MGPGIAGKEAIVVHLPVDVASLVPDVDIHFHEYKRPRSGAPISGKAWYTLPDCDVVREFTGIDRMEAYALAKMDLIKRHAGHDWAQKLEGIL